MKDRRERRKEGKKEEKEQGNAREKKGKELENINITS